MHDLSQPASPHQRLINRIDNALAEAPGDGQSTPIESDGKSLTVYYSYTLGKFEVGTTGNCNILKTGLDRQQARKFLFEQFDSLRQHAV